MRDFALVWMILEEHHDETKSWLILYQGGIKVDFSVTPIDALQTLIDEKNLMGRSAARLQNPVGQRWYRGATSRADPAQPSTIHTANTGTVRQAR